MACEINSIDTKEFEIANKAFNIFCNNVCNVLLKVSDNFGE